MIVKTTFVIFLFGFFSLSNLAESTLSSSRTEIFTFSSNGTTYHGKIYLPESYKTNKELPTIYLIDFTEQHFKLAADEFERLIDAVRQMEGFEALVVSLENIPDIDAEPDKFQEHYDIYKNMAAYVEEHYTNNSSRTFVGKGSEGGLVLMVLFIENGGTSVFENFVVTDPSPKYATAIIGLIEKGNISEDQVHKKLHFSFSTSNDRSKCIKLIDMIKQANYSWLQHESVEYTNSDYEHTYPISYAAGIKYIFQHGS